MIIRINVESLMNFITETIKKITVTSNTLPIYYTIYLNDVDTMITTFKGIEGTVSIAGLYYNYVNDVLYLREVPGNAPLIHESLGIEISVNDSSMNTNRY